jgi:hypothetical protein
MKITKKTLQEIRQGFALAGYNPDLATDFIKGVWRIGKNLGYLNPDEFTAQALNLMKLESGFNPKAKNTLGYTGLIQFSPNNAKVFGYNPDPLKQLSSIESYLRSNKRTMEQTFGDGVKNRDKSENGSVLLTSVLTGPSSRSLVDPSASKVTDAYGTDNAKYYKNIRAGINNFKSTGLRTANYTEGDYQKDQSRNPLRTAEENFVDISNPSQLINASNTGNKQSQPAIPNNELTLREQMDTYKAPVNNNANSMPSLNDESVANVIKMLQEQQDMLNQQSQQQDMMIQNNIKAQNQNLLQQNKMEQELLLKNKAKEAQMAMDNQRNQLFNNMVLKDDPSIQISAEYRPPKFEMPELGGFDSQSILQPTSRSMEQS